MTYRTRSSNRNGFLVICVLVCIGVATSIISLSTAEALRARRAAKHSQQMRQTEYLRDAGILMSATQLANSVEYSGETWEPEIQDLSRLNPHVKITIERGTNPQQIGVTITAQLGLQGSEMEQFDPSVTKRTHHYIYQIKDN